MQYAIVLSYSYLSRIDNSFACGFGGVYVYSCFVSENIHGIICLAAQTSEAKMHQRKLVCCSAPKSDNKLLRYVYDYKISKKETPYKIQHDFLNGKKIIIMYIDLTVANTTFSLCRV